MTERILFITSTRIGDAVLASGLLKRAVDDHPDALITVACGPLAAPLFENVPRLERIIEMPKRRFGGHWLKLWSAVVGHRWNLVVDIRRSVTGYALRHGEIKRLGAITDDRHRVDLLSSVLGNNDISAPFVFDGPQHVDEAQQLLGDGPIIGLGLGASRRDKIWPTDRFVALARQLRSTVPALHDARIALFGGPGEEPLGVLFSDQGDDLPVVNLVGRTHLLTAHACFKRLSLFVGNDSGLMHLASGAGCPTVGLFGQTKGHVYGPWGPCGGFVQAPDFGPMVTIEVEMAKQAAERVLEGV